MTTACIHILLPGAVQIISGNRGGCCWFGVLMWWCPIALKGGIENGDPPQPTQLVLHSIPILFPSISLRHFAEMVGSRAPMVSLLLSPSSALTLQVLPSLAPKPALLTEPYMLETRRRANLGSCIG